ncbi:MAG: hypothetical protein AAF747_09560 [Planctomycetota bacterium]
MKRRKTRDRNVYVQPRLGHLLVVRTDPPEERFVGVRIPWHRVKHVAGARWLHVPGMGFRGRQRPLIAEPEWTGWALRCELSLIERCRRRWIRAYSLSDDWRLREQAIKPLWKRPGRSCLFLLVSLIPAAASAYLISELLIAPRASSALVLAFAAVFGGFGIWPICLWAAALFTRCDSIEIGPRGIKLLDPEGKRVLVRYADVASLRRGRLTQLRTIHGRTYSVGNGYATVSLIREICTLAICPTFGNQSLVKMREWFINVCIKLANANSGLIFIVLVIAQKPIAQALAYGATGFAMTASMAGIKIVGGWLNGRNARPGRTDRSIASRA